MPRYWIQHAMEGLERQRNPPPEDCCPYSCDLSLLSEKYRDLFIELSRDEKASTFISECYENFNSLSLRSIYTSFARSALWWWGWSNTDINGWLGVGKMHLLSTEQCRLLLGVPEGERIRSLLDVGAGDGEVTKQMAPLFAEVVTTEVSTSMVSCLREKGWECYKADDLSKCIALESRRFDVVSFLNILDRCARPRTLLRQIRALLGRAEGARCLMAVVLPFRAFVENGSSRADPMEQLDIFDESFEISVNLLIERVLEPEGFRVDKISRVPYFSQGDSVCPLYSLDCVMLVLSAGFQIVQADDSN
eukprot:175635_1